MRRAIRKYLVDFLAVLGVMAVGTAIGAYVLSHERVRFPLIEEAPFRVKAVLQEAQAVTPGQGQSVQVAGVKIGDIGDVQLENGRAVVTLDLEPRFRHLVRRGSTALLRSKTGLKDMFIEIDPGRGPPLPEDGRIPASNTAPDINLDEVLAALDSDTRDHLKLLISSGGRGLAGRGPDLREVLRRLGPVHRDLARVTRATARHRRNLRRLVRSYGLLTGELGRADRDFVRLVRAGSAVFESLASEKQNLSRSTAEFPSSLRETRRALAKVDVLGRRLAPAAAALRPAARSLDPAARALLPLAREGTPILRDRIRPLARVARPRLEDLGAGAGRLARAAPDLTKGVSRLNRLLNLLAYNPGGPEGLTGDFARDRARQEGALYWLAWSTQSVLSVLGTADSQGVYRRFTFVGTDCSVFTAIGLPATVTGLLGTAGICSGS